MTIGLTGASGNLGRLTVEELLTGGVSADQIVAVVRDPAKVTDLADRGVQVRQADYASPAGWREALDGVDRLLLVSGSGPGASQSHKTVIDAAVEAGVGHISYTSILNADTTNNPLAPEHHATEQLIQASGIPFAILRNAWYHELFTRLIPQHLATGEIVDAVGEAQISGAARADLAAAAAVVLASGGSENRIYELGGTAFTMNEFARELSAASGQSITHRALDDDDFAAHLEATGVDGGMAAFMTQNDASLRAGEMYTDSTDLADLVGRLLRPLAVSVRQGL